MSAQTSKSDPLATLSCLHPEERRRNFVVAGVLVAQWCRDCFARRDFAIMSRDTESDLIAAMILDGAPDPFYGKTLSENGDRDRKVS